MKEFVSTVSYINNDDSFDVDSEFVLSRPKSFFDTQTLRNLLLQKLFHISYGTIFIAHVGKLYGIRLILEKLKADGFIAHHGEGTVFCDYPKFNYFGIFYRARSGKDSEIQTTWGYCLLNEDSEIALSKALGECIERESSCYLLETNTVHYPTLQQGDASFLYPYIPKFTKTQIHQSSTIVSSSSDLKNVAGFYAKSLTGDTKRFFPVEAFYWGQVGGVQKKLIQHPTSSGSGAGTSYERAVLSATYELIERDHLFLYWFSGIHPQRIKNDSLQGEFGTYIKECRETYNLEVYFLDLQYDTDVLVAGCVIIDPVLNFISMGAKAGTDGEQVLKSAFLEALAVLSSIRMKKEAFSEEKLDKILNYVPFSQIISRKDRVNMYASPKGTKLMRDTFLQGEYISYTQFKKNIPNFDSSKKELQYVIEKLKALVTQKGLGYHAYIHVFTSKWLKKLRYHAAHVFIPKFLKIHLNETEATPLSERLVEFAHSKGKEIKSEEDLNRLPHFFP